MKNPILFIALLAVAALSCQNSPDQNAEKLRRKVVASPEFAALVEARKNKATDLVREMEEERRRFQQELEGLTPEEQRQRREERAKEREAQQQEQQKKKELMEERNRQIRALMRSEEKLSKEVFEEAVRKIDESLGITAEITAPAGTASLNAAMKALMDKFPAISEQDANFIPSCFEAYEAQHDKEE